MSFDISKEIKGKIGNIIFVHFPQNRQIQIKNYENGLNHLPTIV